MTTAAVNYLGHLRTTAVHLQSNNQIITDAPVDNHGKGEAFSPTDLLATSLACCMLTVMGIKAESMGLDLSNSQALVTKNMATEPRRVSEIQLELTVTGNLSERDQAVLKQVGLNCPVAKSLHPDIKQQINFKFI